MTNGTARSERERIDAARQACAVGDYAAAVELLAGNEDALGIPAAVATSVDGLEVWGTATYGDGDLEGAIAAWERAFALAEEQGDGASAARAAATVALHLLMDTGLMSTVRVWLRRADAVSDGTPEGPSHALVALVRMYERFFCGDVGAAAAWSERSIELGRRHGVSPAVTMGRICHARSAILTGDDLPAAIEELDDVFASLLGGDLDAMTIGIAWCELICAVQALGLYERATVWTEAMERWRHGSALGAVSGRCRVHRAEVLRLRGDCAEAEDEALHACDELRPWLRREFGWPLTELGTIRYRRGDLDGAEEAFRDAHEHAWDPHPGLALIHLARGDVGGAQGLIEQALRRPLEIPSKEQPPFGALRRAPLLLAQIEIAAAAGNTAGLASATEELGEIAGTFATPALAAAADGAMAQLLLATGDGRGAVEAARRTVAAWVDIGVPWEAAAARVVLGRAEASIGNVAAARLELASARTTFERIGASYWAGLVEQLEDGGEDAGRAVADAAAAVPDAVADQGTFARDGDTRTAAFAGRTVTLRDLKGMHYLERMLREPGREFHALDLVSVERGILRAGAPPGPEDGLERGDGSMGTVIDERARQAYKRRLEDIEREIDDATSANDPERAELARVDRDYLVRELRRAIGLGGRPRLEGATAERARMAVTRALRYSLGRIGEHHTELAEHLERTVRTGTYCAYDPDPRAPVTWTT